MFSLMKWMMKEYCTLLIKMALNTPKKSKGYYKFGSPSESENVIWFVVCVSIVGSSALPYQI